MRYFTALSEQLSVEVCDDFGGNQLDSALSRTSQHPAQPVGFNRLTQAASISQPQNSRSVAGWLLTEAGGLRGVPLAQFGAVGHVPALQHEASMAAVVQRGALHRGPGGLGRHPAVLQGCPHPRTQLHWNPARTRGKSSFRTKRRKEPDENRILTSSWLKIR